VGGMTIAITKDQEMAAHWKTQIEQCDKSNNKWHTRAKKICQNYRDEREQQDAGVAKRLNLFWSNVQTLKPVIYSKTPVPICERRFLDKDTTGRVASTILERALRYEVSMSGFDSTIRRSRDDYLLPGRGQVWVRYNPQFGEPISPETKADDDIESTDGTNEVIGAKQDENTEAQEREFLSESLAVDYVHWQDFYIFPANARTWVEVEGVGRRLFMSRTDMEASGFDDWKTIELDHVPKIDETQGSRSTVSGQEGMQATVFEIWWKPDKKVYFVAKSHSTVVKEADDPLNLEGFFPCPEPLSATMTNDTMIPVPDYAESQDQYIQIDELTKRIDILTASTKVVGVYDAAAQSLKRVFEEAEEPNLIPVDSWAMFAEKGGLKGAIDWVPIDNIAKTLQILVEIRTQIMEDLDRTTGISDIMRGTSDARETMGGQRLKSNNSSMRVSERQDDMARFCRDIISIMGEIVSEHFSPETLIMVSGAMYDEGLDPPDIAPQIANQLIGHNGGPPMQSSSPQPQSAPGPQPAAPMPPQGSSPPGAPAGPQQPPSFALPSETPDQKQLRKMQLLMDAIGLLRQDKLRGFRIDIETDSTVQGDAEQEKEQRISFLQGVTGFIEQAAQVTQMVPEFAPLAAKMLGFAVRGFRVGRDLESAIEDFCDKAELDAKAKAANPQTPPNPELIKAQADAALAQHKIQTESQQNQIDAMKAHSEVQAQQVEAASEQRNSEMETRRKEMEIASDQRLKEFDLKLKEMDVLIARIKVEAEERKAHLAGVAEDRKAQHESLAFDRDARFAEEEHHRKGEMAKADHQRKMAESPESDDKLKELHDHINAPVEFVRDETGKVSHVKKGKTVRKIVRDDRGVVSGLH
jgi:hypothetical protein